VFSQLLVFQTINKLDVIIEKSDNNCILKNLSIAIKGFFIPPFILSKSERTNLSFVFQEQATEFLGFAKISGN